MTRRAFRNIFCELMQGYPLCAAYILAGGHSRRFGSNKALAHYRGVSLVEHVAKRVQSCADTVIVVGKQDRQYESLSLTTIADLLSDLGPLGGLYTAAAHHASHYADAPWFLLTGCDLIDVQSAWAQRLYEQITDDARAVAFCSDEWHPLFALYHAASLSAIESALTNQQRSLKRFLETIPTVKVAPPHDWNLAKNINTVEDLTKAVS